MRIRIPLLAAALAAALLITGCAQSPPRDPRPSSPLYLEPQASGEVTLSNELASIDASHADQGYIQVMYTGDAAKAKIQITDPEGILYTYTLQPGAYVTLPLTGGSGVYTFTVMENAFDNIYALVFTGEVAAEDMDLFLPYLYPNQYVWFTPDSQIYGLGAELSARSADDLDYVGQVYSFVVESIDYDHDLAASMPVEYLPDIDRTLERKMGICLDYASLMTALLRSQGIPTKLVVGYSGQTYHAWISVYLEQTGWMEGVIFFDGTSWSRIDPTLAAGNRDTSIKDYVNNNDNYREKYFY